MTRFLMSLEDSVDLVLYAFQHGQQGDIFVQKAPASTVADLASALKELFSSDTVVKTIGTRHGEKLYESLISREEMAHAQDMATTTVSLPTTETSTMRSISAREIRIFPCLMTTLRTTPAASM